MIRVLPFLAALLGALALQTPAFAAAMYDVSVSVGVALAPGNHPLFDPRFSGLSFFPGVGFAPAP